MARSPNCLDCYSNSASGPEFQAGCKAYLLELLYHLARHFRSTELAHTEYAQRQQQSMLLGRLVAFLKRSTPERCRWLEAAAVVENDRIAVHEVLQAGYGHEFRNLRNPRAAGPRLRAAASREDFSIAEVASAVGFSDQSYFDRKFKDAFHQTPREVKSNKRKPTTSPAESS